MEGEGIWLQKKETIFTESLLGSKHGAKYFYNIDSITAKTISKIGKTVGKVIY